MARKLLFLFFIISVTSVWAQDEDIIPCSYISRHFKDTISIGNTHMSAKIWGEKDGLYINLDQGKMKIDIEPCVWDFNFKETLDYNDGTAIVENSYFKLKIFFQRDCQALWIKGKCQSPSKIALIKNGENWPYMIDSDGLDEDGRDFTIRISLGEIDFMNYRKAYNQNKVYWNDFWQRSFIKIEGRDSIITNKYNRQRWQNATGTTTGPEIRDAIRSGDWDIFKLQIEKKEKTLSTLNLMMEYFSCSEDESFLHRVAVPLAQEILRQNHASNDTSLYFQICNRFLDIPPKVVIPEDLFEIVSSAPMIHKSERQEETLQEQMLNETFPPQWDVRFKLWKEGRQCIKGDFISGKWKRKPHVSHQELFL